MKSPWKLIGQLFSGRNDQALPQGPAESDVNVSDASHAERDAGEASAAVSPLSDGSNVRPEAETEALAAFDDNRLDPAGDAGAPTDAAPSRTADLHSEETPEMPVAQAPRRGAAPRPRRYKSRTGKAVRPATAKAPARATTPIPRGKPPVTFEDEVATVEAELRTLSRQLAQKLRLQNAQLRKMLERFEDV